MRYSECFITFKIEGGGGIGTDENVRFHGDSGTERIRLDGFYCT